MRRVASEYKHECDSRATRAAVDFESEAMGRRAQDSSQIALLLPRTMGQR
ncbi:hypothetical protein BDM02DRAFT_3112808 [Thelephora ganbajun]|uniref:Uncharacterized protein n=1 Tax=Thelephora ganbajun TaxID=370292 RepID=A0ACB6ZLI7_THEGA|nr:hypothetical protein BDM02DRAFT_3112808 [Thelephora ganbajun]